MTELTDQNLDGVAVVGMAGRFPGADSYNELWENLCNGIDSISFFAKDEINSSVSQKLRNNPYYIKARGVLEDADRFDADFFGFSKREAEVTDPQLRIFLELAWSALEDAGYHADAFNGMIGVFAGKGNNSYYINNILSHPDIIEAFGEFPIRLANEKDFLAPRVAYKLNLKGPSINVNTACSTSLVTVCLAFDSLLSYQCDMALAGGITITFPQNCGYLYQEGATDSADGRCRPFDAAASGTVIGSGGGVVVLKRIEDALKAGDHIYGVIRGTAITNDGADKVSFSALSIEGQVNAVALAQASADIDPEDISYIEAHGTATQIGDAIEVEALKRVFGENSGHSGQDCKIGSIKSNIGHLETAAGVSALIKTCLALKYKKLPPSLYFETPNPEIDFNNSPFTVNTRLVDWETNGRKRCAGVSAFGVGGTNAHVIVEEAPEMNPSGTAWPVELLQLSAKTEAALKNVAERLGEYLGRHPEVSLADAAFTLSLGRKEFNHRQIVVCRNHAEAIQNLSPDNIAYVRKNCVEVENPPIAFIFPTEGCGYVNMARSLYQVESVFTQTVDQCADILYPIIHTDIRTRLYPQAKDRNSDSGSLPDLFTEDRYRQPSLFTVEYALGKLWQQWGVTPNRMIGHGVGEYVAGCLAGIFSLEAGLRFACLRGQAVQDDVIESATFFPPEIPVISTATGAPLTSHQATDADYWIGRLKAESECFQEGIRTIAEEDSLFFLFVGPGLAGETVTGKQAAGITNCDIYDSLGNTADKDSELRTICMTLGQLWLNGVRIDWSQVYDNRERRRIPLPAYPFERKRFWLDSAFQQETKKAEVTNGMLIETGNLALSQLEAMLVKIWKSLFGNDDITASDDFFSLGGDSLLAVQMFSKVNEFTNVNLPLTSLIDASNLKDLARLIDDALKKDNTEKRLEDMDEISGSI